jgi:hypothetical protein
MDFHCLHTLGSIIDSTMLLVKDSGRKEERIVVIYITMQKDFTAFLRYLLNEVLPARPQ